ncbi:MAG: L,D-transpeptidase family protein [Hyphomicrobiales bacterium]
MLVPWAFSTSFVALSTAVNAETIEERTFSWDDGIDPSARKTKIAEGKHERPMLGADSEQSILEAIARYQIFVRRGGWPKIPRGHAMVVGSKGKRVEVLTHRLMIAGDLVPPEGFDPSSYGEAVQKAVARFQERHGLLASGKVDERTRRALNVPAAERLKALEANLPRVRKYSQGLSGRYVVVNIPSAELEAVEDGYLYSRHNTVVGKLDRPTPEVMSDIVQLNFNPYWHAPISIAEKDIIPQLRKGLSYLKKINIRVFKGSYYGEEVDPRKVDWTKASAKTYFFRQEPGESNAMASVRINFPNDHDVYLHDTPGKGLFAQAVRYDSSGCVRVDDVGSLVKWLLKGQNDWSSERVDEVTAERERLDVQLGRRVPLRIVYLTAWATSDGSVHFRPDIYARPKPDTKAKRKHKPKPPSVATFNPPRPKPKPDPKQAKADAGERQAFDPFNEVR